MNNMICNVVEFVFTPTQYIEIYSITLSSKILKSFPLKFLHFSIDLVRKENRFYIFKMTETHFTFIVFFNIPIVKLNFLSLNSSPPPLQRKKSAVVGCPRLSKAFSNLPQIKFYCGIE